MTPAQQRNAALCWAAYSLVKDRPSVQMKGFSMRTFAHGDLEVTLATVDQDGSTLLLDVCHKRLKVAAFRVYADESAETVSINTKMLLEWAPPLCEVAGIKVNYSTAKPERLH